MRLLLFLQGFTLLQNLLCVSTSTIPVHALAIVPPQLSTIPRTETPSLPRPIKRAWPDPHHNFFVFTSFLGTEWILRFNVLEFVAQSNGNRPAREMVQFYRAALAVARAVWRHSEPKTVRRAGMNGVTLMFWSDQPIEWDFLNSFFEHIVSSLL